MINAPHRGATQASRSPADHTSVMVATVLLTAGILIIDLSSRPGVDVGVLYVVPLLIGGMGAPPSMAILAGWIYSVLVLGGMMKAPWSTLPLLAFLNRAISLVVIWATASIVYRFRDTTARLEQRTRDLADMSYALDQSAIVATTDLRGRITFANDRFCDISKYSHEELIGQDHRIVNSGYHPKEFMRSLWQTIANGHIWHGEIRNRAKDGSFYWVDTTIVPFLDAHGKPYQYMAIRYEITDRKRSEELLREQAALTRLGEMAAVVAHEVKNPIAGIRGALQVIASRMAPDLRDRAVIGDIISRLDTLNGIVQDLLQFARPRQIRAEPTPVGPFISSTIELLRRDPAFAAIEVQVTGGDMIVQADREQLQLVFQNIFINAAQAMGGAGRIEVEISPNADGCRIAIADRGPGMSPEVQAKAFDAFFTTKHRGTGLGLPIARRVTEMHGGHIVVEAREGGGTVIAIQLPAAG